MRRHKNTHSDYEMGLANFALTFGKAMFVCMIMFIVMLIPDVKKNEPNGVKPKAEALITMTWPHMGDDDIDIWIETPSGRILYYGSGQVGFLNLDRDDTGTKTNTVIINDKVIENKNHEEIVTIRGIEPGEYSISVHMYRTTGHSALEKVQLSTPMPVEIRIIKLNPVVKEVYFSTTNIVTSALEYHVTRFTMTETGEITDFTNQPPKFIRKTIENQTVNSGNENR